MGNPNWRTPYPVFKTLDDQYHYNIDGAADHESALLPIYNTLDGMFCNSWAMGGWRNFEIFRIADCNGLTYPYVEGDRVFINPPYNNIRPWLEMCHDRARYGALFTLLIPPNVDTAAYHKYIWDAELKRARGRVEVNFPPGRIRFLHPTTMLPGGSPPEGNLIVTFWPNPEGEN